jgi:AcrR family transcriptional regulator
VPARRGESVRAGAGAGAPTRAHPAPTRRYRSPQRAQQAARTREAVLAAATELFSARGWAGTSVRDIAAAAGVSVETVYSAAGSKIDLLIAAVDAGVVGDFAEASISERPEFAAVATGADRPARALAAARLASGINRRTAGPHRALREAATTDAGAAQRLRELEESRRTTLAQGLALVAGRPVTDDERDTAWAVSSVEVHQLLVGISGWSEEHYQAWLADTVVRALAEDTGHKGDDR